MAETDVMSEVEVVEVERPAKILVAEDDVNLLHGIRAILQIDKYEVLTAKNGKEALDIMKREAIPPDLIISDIMMPFMDGRQLLKAVREESRWLDVRFIFLTAKSGKDDIQDGVGLGADDYVTKPYDPDYLRTTVRSKLKQQATLNKYFANEVEQIKGNILTILNHEFRTPLTFVVAYADMLDMPADEGQKNHEEMMTYLKGVSSGANRLRNLIENFITLVELKTDEASKAIAFRKKPITDLRPFLEDVKTAALERIEATYPIEIRADDPIPPFEAHEEYFQRTLYHLLDNAMKFSEPSDQIVMRARQEGNRVAISVQDYGRGIPADKIDLIWNLFYQIDRDHYEDQGAGSGLAIVKDIVELHGGKVEVESVFGTGSTFTIRLPLKTN